LKNRIREEVPWQRKADRSKLIPAIPYIYSDGMVSRRASSPALNLRREDYTDPLREFITKVGTTVMAPDTTFSVLSSRLGEQLRKDELVLNEESQRHFEDLAGSKQFAVTVPMHSSPIITDLKNINGMNFMVNGEYTDSQKPVPLMPYVLLTPAFFDRISNANEARSVSSYVSSQIEDTVKGMSWEQNPKHKIDAYVDEHHSSQFIANLLEVRALSKQLRSILDNNLGVRVVFTDFVIARYLEEWMRLIRPDYPTSSKNTPQDLTRNLQLENCEPIDIKFADKGKRLVISYANNIIDTELTSSKILWEEIKISEMKKWRFRLNLYNPR